MAVKVLVVKTGFIGCATLFEILLDERANRKDIDVSVVTSGCKLDVDAAQGLMAHLEGFRSDFTVMISPNVALPGPAALVDFLARRGTPLLVISDGASRKAVSELEAKGAGYLVIEADAMIGARREFLDPVEMTLFNSDLMKVLAVTGVFRLLVEEVDGVIEAVKRRDKIKLPSLIVDFEEAVKYADITNPYARGKAMASYEIAKGVANLSSFGAFKIKERERYLPIVAAAHEMMRQAGMLADEAREIEKGNDSVHRKMHLDDGSSTSKRRLFDSL